MKRQYILLILVALITASVTAQESRTQKIINAALRGWDIELRCGYNIGGTSPLPLPAEIREIKSFSPSTGFTAEANFTKRITDSKFGILFGVKVDNKYMDTDARVKNYGMEIIDNGAKAEGKWTGGVKTKVRNSYLTVPIQGVYRVHPRTNLKLGMFFSYLMEGEFSGYVYDGYLRNIDPTGEKATFSGDAIATYDFSEDLNKFQYGLQIGADWKAFKHLKVYGDLSWGLNSVFPSSFKTITFKMYPISFNPGVGYIF